jgi:ATP-dependent Clp protease ATP-binding subunit ClpB
MTSNLGSQFIAEHAGALNEGIRRQVTEALRQHFRPEFINRIDEIVFFHGLGLEHMKSIIDIQVQGLLKRLHDRKIRVELSDSAKSALVAEGYDPAFGARPLKRTLQRRILDPLALKILDGEVREGDHVSVDADGDQVAFKVQRPASAVA